jgi:hypothetical protein
MIDKNFAQTKPTIPQRPTLLTVLCILTFLGSSWGIFDGFINIFKAKTIDTVGLNDQLQTEMDKLNDSGTTGETLTKLLEGAMDVANKAIEKAIPLAIFSIIASMLSIFGAYLMWNLKKSGFYIYITAQIISLFGIFYLLGLSFASIAIVGFGGLLSLIFTILYGVNLKYMH